MRRTPFAHIVVLITFLINSLGIVPASAQEIVLPKPGVMISLSPPMNPPVLKGIKVHADNPFRFDFVLDKGDEAGAIHESPVQDDATLKEESTKLIKYFLASLTIPEKDLWVNLSPYEKDRIVPESFGVTEMGRDLLAEDYMLKQITASLIYPEGEIGKKFWKRIYEEAQKKYGNANIPVNTFNKVWIVPEKAVVYENAKAGTAYVVESRLKVMLEADYLSMEKHTVWAIHESPIPNKDVNQLGSQIVREIVIPELTKEVNEGKNFAQLRQVYNSLILATWYKKKIKDSILVQVYADKKKTLGIGINTELNVETIYQRYLQAFKKGVYNYIKEEPDPITSAKGGSASGGNQTIPRKYFSGGLDLLNIKEDLSFAQASAVYNSSNEVLVTSDFAMSPDKFVSSNLTKIKADQSAAMAPDKINIKEVMKFVGSKWGLRQLLANGGIIKQPEWFVTFNRDTDQIRNLPPRVHDESYSERLMNKRYVSQFKKTAQEIVNGEIKLPVIYKPYFSSLGQGIFFIHRAQNKDLLITFPYVTSAPILDAYQNSVIGYFNSLKISPTSIGPNMRQVVLDGHRNDLVDILYGLWKVVSINRFDYDSGGMESLVDAFKLDGMSYESRFIFLGNLSTGRFDPAARNMHQRDSWLQETKVGNSSLSSHYIGRVGARLLFGDNQYNDLLDFYHIPRVRWKEFETYVYSQIERDFKLMSSRLISAGIKLDENIKGSFDLQWLPPAKEGDFPIPFLIEDHMFFAWDQRKADELDVRSDFDGSWVMNVSTMSNPDQNPAMTTGENASAWMDNPLFLIFSQGHMGGVDNEVSRKVWEGFIASLSDDDMKFLDGKIAVDIGFGDNFEELKFVQEYFKLAKVFGVEWVDYRTQAAKKHFQDRSEFEFFTADGNDMQKIIPNAGVSFLVGKNLGFDLGDLPLTFAQEIVRVLAPHGVALVTGGISKEFIEYLKPYGDFNFQMSVGISFRRNAVPFLKPTASEAMATEDNKSTANAAMGKKNVLVQKVNIQTDGRIEFEPRRVNLGGEYSNRGKVKLVPMKDPNFIEVIVKATGEELGKIKRSERRFIPYDVQKKILDKGRIYWKMRKYNLRSIHGSKVIHGDETVSLTYTDDGDHLLVRLGERNLGILSVGGNSYEPLFMDTEERVLDKGRLYWEGERLPLKKLNGDNVITDDKATVLLVPSKDMKHRFVQLEGRRIGSIDLENDAYTPLIISFKGQPLDEKGRFSWRGNRFNLESKYANKEVDFITSSDLKWLNVVITSMDIALGRIKLATDKYYPFKRKMKVSEAMATADGAMKVTQKPWEATGGLYTFEQLIKYVKDFVKNDQLNNSVNPWRFTSSLYELSKEQKRALLEMLPKGDENVIGGASENLRDLINERTSVYQPAMELWEQLHPLEGSLPDNILKIREFYRGDVQRVWGKRTYKKGVTYNDLFNEMIKVADPLDLHVHGTRFCWRNDGFANQWTMLNIMIQGAISKGHLGSFGSREKYGDEFVNASYWGPYYVILRKNAMPVFDQEGEAAAGFRSSIRDYLTPYYYIQDEDQLIYLVPDESARDFMIKGVQLAVKKGFIKNKDAQMRIDRLVTYEQFIALKELLPNIINGKMNLQKALKERFANNAAMARKGGIDLTSKEFVETQNAGEGIKFHMDPAMLAQLQNAPGFYPVIINIQPMTNLRVFLGISEKSGNLQGVG